MFDRASWQRWRGLFDALRESDPGGWEGDVLLPWVEANAPAVAELHRIGHADNRSVVVPRDPTHHTPLETLYVLSRVLDLLIAPPVTGDPGPVGSVRPHPGYGAFGAALGCRRIEEEEFHPFLHEIVEVLPAGDPDEPVRLVGQRWPGLFAGSMLVTRAGVMVRAGANRLVPEVAERSTLYWAWRRHHRPVLDLSHAWGSNSQWGTDFRRDYWADGRLYYNVDAGHRRPIDHPELSREAAHDLLRYRCGTTVDVGRDQWIWDTGLVEPAPR
ncbi:hypothetical protein GCM10023322_80880 [Rugosimonospora acidiphila]|uniref:Uncharacterized protein n=1 Tax=Rugosimonospora acidiphila TaxID=556531 RepID=A0ABP9SV78_9ACTN